MDKITDIIQKLIVNPLSYLSEKNYLRSITGGVLMIVPFAMVASLFLFIAFVPIPGWMELVAPYEHVLTLPMKVTLNVFGVFVVVGVAYRLAQHYEIDDIKTPLIALSSFFLLQLQTDFKVNVERFGVDSFLIAIITAILTVEIARFFEQKPLLKNRFVHVPEAVFTNLNSVVAPLIMMILVMIVKVVWDVNLNEVSLFILMPVIFVLDSWWGFGLFMFIRVLVWFMGAHGGAALGYIVDPF